VAGQQFARDLTVSADPDKAWAVLTDVKVLSGWVGIVRDVTELSALAQYTAVLEDRIGPFKLRADLDINAQVVEDGRRIEVQASGRDRALDSRLYVTAALSIVPVDGGGSTIVVEGNYQVTGRAATAGAGMIRKKADGIIEDFFRNAARDLNS
jgi:carbon monoxide dehydrogenase subunit G